jgi:hypothetical protein
MGKSRWNFEISRPTVLRLIKRLSSTGWPGSILVANANHLFSTGCRLRTMFSSINYLYRFCCW